MANFTSADVMKLREQTGVGMMDCKKALVATDGNFDEAVKFLREKGMASAAKKQSRVAAEGLVKCYITDDKKLVVCVEVNCETDFVARSDQFIALIDNIAKHIAQSNAQTVEAVLEEAFIRVGWNNVIVTVSDYIAESSNCKPDFTIRNVLLGTHFQTGNSNGEYLWEPFKYSYEANIDKSTAVRIREIKIWFDGVSVQ